MSVVTEIIENSLDLSDMEPMFYDEYVILPKQLFEKIEHFKPKSGKLTLISTAVSEALKHTSITLINRNIDV